MVALLVSFNHLKVLANRKHVISINRIVKQLKTFYERNGPKAGCFAGFCHHCMATMTGDTLSLV